MNTYDENDVFTSDNVQSFIDDLEGIVFDDTNEESLFDDDWD